MNKIQLGVLPSKSSRHNTPSRAHALSKLVSGLSSNQNSKENLIIVCEKRDVFASGCAIARVFPTYSRKTVPGPTDPVATKNVGTNLKLKKRKKKN